MNDTYKFEVFDIKDEAGNIIQSRDDSLDKLTLQKRNLVKISGPEKTNRHSVQGTDIFEVEFKYTGIRLLSMGWSQQRHFSDIFLDFTIPPGEPNAGLPCEKICLTGANGSGKTTILRALQGLYRADGFLFGSNKENIYYTFSSIVFNRIQWTSFYFDDGTNGVKSFLLRGEGAEKIIKLINTSTDLSHEKYLNSLTEFQNNTNLLKKSFDFLDFQEHINKKRKTCLSVISPDESSHGSRAMTLPYNLNTLLQTKRGLQESQQTIGNDNIASFWSELIYLIQKRESEFKLFAESESAKDENLAYKKIKDTFDNEHPEFLYYLSNIWNDILNLVGLEFKPEFFKNPETLTDNIEYFFRYKNNPDQPLQFQQLSGGLKNYLLKIGHIATLWFGKSIPSSFLLLDEPDNGLFPGYVEGLIDKYLEISSGAQMFVTTHNPQIAKQFKPYERIILNINEDNRIHASRGVLNEGYSTEKYLLEEFNVENFYTGETLNNFNFYKYLINKIKIEKDNEKKNILLKNLASIKNKYGF